MIRMKASGLRLHKGLDGVHVLVHSIVGYNGIFLLSSRSLFSFCRSPSFEVFIIAKLTNG